MMAYTSGLLLGVAVIAAAAATVARMNSISNRWIARNDAI